MAHITLSQLSTILERIVSWAGGKFAAKNTISGKLNYADLPIVVLASMGHELDGTTNDRTMSVGDTYFLPAEAGTVARILYRPDNGNPVKVSDPVSNVIYCNAYTGMLYRWDSTMNLMIQVGGGGDGLRKVYVGVNSIHDFSSLDALHSHETSGVYQVIDQSSQRIIGILVVASDTNPHFVTQWLFSNLTLQLNENSDSYSGSINGNHYTIGKAHILHRFYNVSAAVTAGNDIPLNTWSKWKVYGLTLDEMAGLLSSKANDNAVVKSISVNGGTPQTPQNGNVNIEVQAGEQGQKGDTGNCQITGDGGNIVALIVNNLTTGGAGNILSAEMGRRLAMMSGTYAQAWARSKAIPFPFCFLWIETVEGVAVSKPIWHKGNSVFVDAAGAIVNVDAAAVPATPTITGATGGTEVPKNTQITITPAAGSVLYYSLDGGSTFQVSDSEVAVTLANAGSVSIVAYCANNAGNSSNATLNITVAGTPVPVFSPSQGEVSRGGTVTISLLSGGELHYKVGNGSWQTASGTSASVQITGNTTIQAYNVKDGDTSDTVSADFFMEALAAPTFSKNAGELVEGTEVAINMPLGATKVYYNITTDNTEPADPTASSTEYSGAITINSATRIKAVAEDAYGLGLVASVSYTVREDALIIDTTDAAGSVTINGTAYPLDSSTPPPDGSTGYRNTIPYSQMTDVTNKTITSITFSAPATIKRIYGGGGKIAFSENTFTSAATTLTLIEADVTGSNHYGTFKKIGSNWGAVTLRLSGTLTNLLSVSGYANLQLTLDISRLVPPSGGFMSQGMNGFIQGCSSTVLIISETFAISASNPASDTNVIFKSAKMTTLKIVSSTPPDLTSVNWLDGILATKTDSSKLNIRVPVGSLETYQNADSSISKGWGAYAENEKITWSTF